MLEILRNKRAFYKRMRSLDENNDDIQSQKSREYMNYNNESEACSGMRMTVFDL